MKNLLCRTIAAAMFAVILVTAMPVSAAAQGGRNVLDGINVTITDRATPAVNMRGRVNDPTTMLFIAADGREIGAITFRDYNAVIAANRVVIHLEGGAMMGVPPDGSGDWNGWLAGEFNRLRGIGADAVSAAVAEQQAAAATTNAERVEQYRRELIRLVNLERERAGLPAYIVDYDLMADSQVRARELSVRYSHYRPDCGTHAGFEIIYGSRNSPANAVQRWMNSPGHRAAILNERRVTVGAGVYITEGGIIYWQMFFGFYS